MSEVKFKNTNGEWITGFKDVEVVNDLTTSNSSKGVAALQGKELNDKIDSVRRINYTNDLTIEVETNFRYYISMTPIKEKLTIILPSKVEEEGINEITLSFETWQGFEFELVGDAVTEALLPNYVYDVKLRYIKNRWVVFLEKAIKIPTARLIGTLTDGSAFDESYRSEDEAKAFITSHKSDLETIKIIEEDGMFTSCYAMFYEFGTVKEIDLNEFNTKNVTTMYRMFSTCSSLVKLEVSNFDTVKVTSMQDMFKYCSLLTKLDVSNFNTSNVTGGYGIFSNCKLLTKIDVSNWDTSNFTTMYSMFHTCSSLIELDISNFDTSKVTNMIHTFNGCSSLTSLDLTPWNIENLTVMDNMVQYCSKLTYLDLSTWDINSSIGMVNSFSYCPLITEAYGKTQEDCDILNSSYNKSTSWNFILKSEYASLLYSLGVTPANTEEEQIEQLIELGVDYTEI